MNMLDYITWRGDLTMREAPPTPVDSLIMANLVYNDLGHAHWTDEGMTLGELAPQLDLMERTGNIFFEKWRTLLYRMAESRRYRDLLVRDYVDVVDSTLGIQFAAATFEAEGLTYVAFRGTDNTLVGWHEDFCLAFESPVPAQREAVRYLEKAAAKTRNPIAVVGHSKGGCLAAYAGACVSAAVQARLKEVCSFDGPGLSDEVMESAGYAAIRDRLHSVIPQSSVVGLLLDYHSDYQVVHSTAAGILQHDSFSWQLADPFGYEEEKEIDAASRVTKEGLHAWLKACTPQQRRTFTEALFEVLGATHAATTNEIGADALRSAIAMAGAVARMEPETREVFVKTAHLLMGKMRESAVEALNDSMAEERKKLLELPQNMVEDLHEKAEELAAKRREEPQSLDLVGAVHGLLESIQPNRPKPAEPGVPVLIVPHPAEPAKPQGQLPPLVVPD